MPPKIPTRTDAYIACACGGTMVIVSVAPIPDKSDLMRHTYRCRDCGKDATFDVAKKGVVAKTLAKTTAAKKTRR